MNRYSALIANKRSRSPRPVGPLTSRRSAIDQHPLELEVEEAGAGVHVAEGGSGENEHGGGPEEIRAPAEEGHTEGEGALGLFDLIEDLLRIGQRPADSEHDGKRRPDVRGVEGEVGTRGHAGEAVETGAVV